MILITAVAGLMAGATIGVLVMACLVAGSRADDHAMRRAVAEGDITEAQRLYGREQDRILQEARRLAQ